MSRVARKLRNRVLRGGLPLAYDIYNEADINEICTCITATGNLCWDRVGTVVIFEVSEDEQ